jgi:methylmalonyl-CoA mutase
MPKILEEFPPASTAEWEAAIRADLHGAQYESLLWPAEDGITVQPFYRSADVPATAALQAPAEWLIADEHVLVTIDAAKFEENGATTVQELAFALTEGIEHLAGGGSHDIVFGFAIGSSYFFQIAKLRAFRLLWNRVIEAFGIAEAKTTLHCRTSRWNKSIYDAHVNIVRATTEAMSAVLGGANSITVTPFNSVYKQPDDASRRLARNTQLILKHEAHLDRARDAAAGSYFIEALTGSLARNAWSLMQEIEQLGGYKKALDRIESDIARSREKKESEIGHRRRTFIGVNRYPNPAERMLDKIEPGAEAGPRRAPQVFEDIRLDTERPAVRPVFVILELGDSKTSRARSQFALDLFACGGFETEIRRFRVADDIDIGAAAVIVLCGADAEYPTVVPRLIAMRPDTPVIVAGYPEALVDELKAAGVAGFIRDGIDAAATLRHWQGKLGIR